MRFIERSGDFCVAAPAALCATVKQEAAMYRYDDYDHALVAERVEEFRDQVARYLAGALTDEEFLPLRLQNGLYRQKHAYMLRVAIPYGLLSAAQLHKLAEIAERYDRGYGHFSTRQNIQFNWIQLEQVPDILAELASVEMHAIQTSGNVVRNVTTDQFAGIAADEIMDPRPLAELIRQWSTLNPEFAYLPRKFKIAVSAAAEDRAAIRVHDVGLDIYRDANGEVTVRVIVGGGLGRTPMVGVTLREHLHWSETLTYLEAILRVYNRYGRRDNKYKARIKILVKALGVEAFAREVETEWAHLSAGPGTLTPAEYERVTTQFSAPLYEALTDDLSGIRVAATGRFRTWLSRNLHPHRISGYSAVTLSTKADPHTPAGDVNAQQLRQLAKLAQRYSFGEVRVTHEQNLVLPDVQNSDLFALYTELDAIKLAAPNLGLLTDMIVCPGGDYCSLANARSLPVARAIAERFDNLDYLLDLGELSLNISGCMNACGHHSIGNIGVLGVDKDGQEWYQVTVGGAQGNRTRLGKVIGPALRAEQMPNTVEKLVNVYTEQRVDDESFADVVERIGLEPFKARVYAAVAA